MIRVLQVFAILNRGGAESMIMNYYRNIDRSKIQFDFLVYLEGEGHFENEIKSLGGEVYHLSSPIMKNFSKFNKNLNYFFSKNASKYEIIHSHLNSQSVFFLKSAKEYGIPIRIAHSHIAYDRFYFNPTFLRQHVLKRFSRRYATDYAACGEKASNWLFNTSRDVFMMHNSINSDDFVYNKHIKQEMTIKYKLEDKFIVGNIASFMYQKNHSYILDVFNKLLSLVPNAILVLVGDGPLKTQMIEKAKKLDIEDNIIFMGVRKDIPKLLNLFDVFLLPSHYEGLPVTLIEAQASGLKIFASDTVTEEVKITNLIEFISLDKSPMFWAEKIANSITYDRKNMTDRIKGENYDIIEATKLLEKKYIEKVESIR